MPLPLQVLEDGGPPVPLSKEGERGNSKSLHFLRKCGWVRPLPNARTRTATGKLGVRNVQTEQNFAWAGRERERERA